VEIVNIVIPGLNDNEDSTRQLVERHLRGLGIDTPLHFTCYYPAYKFKAPPTPVKILQRVRELARSMGVLFPYIGNVPKHKYENTWCTACGELARAKRFKIFYFPSWHRLFGYAISFSPERAQTSLFKLRMNSGFIMAVSTLPIEMKYSFLRSRGSTLRERVVRLGQRR